MAGITAVLIGGAVVFFMFPKKDEEEALLAQYHAEDMKGVRRDEAGRGGSGRGGSRPAPGYLIETKGKWVWISFH